jgi:hypothetical protein
MKLLWDERWNDEQGRLSYYCIGSCRVRLRSSLEPFYSQNKAIVKTQVEVLNSLLKWRDILNLEHIYVDLEDYSLIGKVGPVTKATLIEKTEKACLEKVVMLLDGA